MDKTTIMNLGSCTINGRVYKNISGVVTIENGRMLVNVKPIEDWNESDEKTINITITGDVDVLEAGCCNTITVKGNANKVRTGSGDVCVEGTVKGCVQTGSGDVRCGDVEEDVSTGSGDVYCGDVKGRVTSSSGDVCRR